MRVLLDECMPRKLRGDLEGHGVRTVPEMGWAAKKNSELLRLAAKEFDVFLTVDRSLIYQQDLQGIPIAVISLKTKSNRLADLRPLMSEVRSILASIQPSQIVRLGA